MDCYWVVASNVKVQHCMAYYYVPGCAGARCERCVSGPACGAGGVCVRDATGAHCRADICRFFCLNGGTCSVSAVGAVACACRPAWSGERCQRPACVDAACTRPPADDNDTHDVPPRDNDTRNNGTYSAALRYRFMSARVKSPQYVVSTLFIIPGSDQRSAIYRPGQTNT